MFLLSFSPTCVRRRLTDPDTYLRYISLLHMIPTGVYIFKYKPGGAVGLGQCPVNENVFQFYSTFFWIFCLRETKKKKFPPEKYSGGREYEVNIHPCLIKSDVSTIDPSELWCQPTVSWFNTFCAYSLKSFLLLNWTIYRCRGLV